MASAVIVFVRERQTFRFLNKEGGWVASFGDAVTFQSTWEACDFCLKKSMHEAEIVLRTGDPNYDVMIDVR